MRPIFFLIIFLTPLFAATGFDYPNPTTLRLFNEVTTPFCIDVVSGVQLDNCGNEWANSTWCVSYRQNANPWTQQCVDSIPFNYRVASDNLTYANVTFYMTVAGSNKFILNYNLTQQQHYLSVQPNFTINSGVPSNTTARFSIISHDIKVNNTVENDTAWFDGKNYSLSLNTTTNNTANTSLSNTFVLYDWKDQEQIFYSWEQKYPTKLDVWPQPGYGNRQTNLTWELGLIQTGKSYAIPIKWNDLEVACDVGTSVFSVSSSMNTSNGTSKNRINITANVFKAGFGNCVYYLYQKLTAAGKPGLMPSSETVNSIDLPVGFVTGGTVNPFSTSAISYRWTVQIGGMNGTTTGGQYTNLTFQINVSGVSDTSGNEQNFKQLAVWDTKPPNATINTTNWTNYTDGNIRIFAFAIDETNMRAVELWSNETGTWKYTDKQNVSSSVINKTIAFNFTRTFTNAITQCYLYGIVAKDTTYDNYTNKWNVTGNVTLCVNKTLSSTAVTPFPTMVYPMQYEEDENKPKLLYYAGLVIVSIACYIAIKRYI